MGAITINQILAFLATIAGAIGSITAIYAVFDKINKKRAERERTEFAAPIQTQLEEIKQQNQELKEQSDDLRKEMILIMKLNQTMISEIQTLGHTNGQTTQALQELNDYLINK